MIKGIILQPISRKKRTWDNYNGNSDVEFLAFFQKTFRDKIGREFYVNHNTEAFSDYLLIPYFTENQKCFGLYYIENGKKLFDSDYEWSYIIDYSKSKDFLKVLPKQNILNESEYNHRDFEPIKVNSILNYYRLDNPPKKLLEFLENI